MGRAKAKPIIYYFWILDIAPICSQERLIRYGISPGIPIKSGSIKKSIVKNNQKNLCLHYLKAYLMELVLVLYC